MPKRRIMDYEFQMGQDSYGEPIGGPQEHPLLRGPNVRGSQRYLPTRKVEGTRRDPTIEEIFRSENSGGVVDHWEVLAYYVIDTDGELKAVLPKDHARAGLQDLSNLLEKLIEERKFLND